MSIAASVFVAAIGAILYFAVNDEISGVDLETVGLILMIAGAVGFVLTFLMEFIRRDRPGEPPRY